MGDKKSEIFIIPEQRRNSDSRRVALETVSTDLRNANRREDDRRGLHLNMGLSSDDTMTKVVSWLITNCLGEWYIGASKDVTKDNEPICRVKFDTVEDLQKFQAWLVNDEGAVRDL